MNHELQIKFNQLIEDNFSKSESAVLVRLISDHEDLKKKDADKDQKIKNIESDLADKRKELSSKLVDIEALSLKVKRLEDQNDNLTKKHDEMKEKFVSLKLECTEKSLEQIFKLTETAFRNPAKVRTFDLPIKTDQYSCSYRNDGSQSYVKSGELIDRHQGQEKIEEI